jgi:hypothetical protein
MAEGKLDFNQKIGAGDGDRTRDIQLGKLEYTLRSTTNQLLVVGAERPCAALCVAIEHNSEHRRRTASFATMRSSVRSRLAPPNFPIT